MKLLQVLDFGEGKQAHGLNFSKKYFMKWTTILAILISTTAKAQTIDTITNAKAYASNYIRTPIYGLTTDGHAYTVGFNIGFPQVLHQIQWTLYGLI